MKFISMNGEPSRRDDNGYMIGSAFVEITLTPEELAEAALKNAVLDKEWRDLQDHKKQMDAQWKKDIETLDFRMKHYATTIRTGREDRHVDVREEPDFRAGIVRIYELETGQEIHVRQMDARERQAEMSFRA